MATLPRIGWVIDVGSRVMRGDLKPSRVLRAVRSPLTATRTGAPGRINAVTLEIGRDNALILAAVYADGRLRLAFGTGEEFVGYGRDLPAKVGAAARNLLDTAASFDGVLPHRIPGHPPPRGMARIAVRTASGVCAEESRIADLKAGRTHLAPLWDAFARLASPLIAVLFETPASTARTGRDSPGLSRARNLWGLANGS